MARLTEKDGCLRAIGDASFNAPDRLPPSYLLIWPKGYALSHSGDTLHVRNSNGRVAARIGDVVRFSGRLVERESDLAKTLTRTVAETCAGPYYLVGDDVSVIGSDEPEVVALSGSTLHFQRLKTVMLRGGLSSSLVGYHIVPHVLSLEDGCLYIRDHIDDSKRYMLVWPPGFRPHVGSGGVVEIRNGGGRTIARVGDRLLLRGDGTIPNHVSEHCNMAIWYVKGVRNADFPLIVPRHKEVSGSDESVAPEFIKGEPRLHNGCLNINGSVLIWASDFTVSDESGSIEVTDEKGGIIAREGQHTILRGRSVDLEADAGTRLSRAVPIDCQADSFWIVRG